MTSRGDFVGTGASWVFLGRQLDAPTSPWWDDVTTTDVIETAETMVLRAMDEAGAELRESLGGPDRWAWGRLHTATFEEGTIGMSGIGPLEWYVNDGPFAVDGASGAVNATTYRLWRAYPDPLDPEFVPLGVEGIFTVTDLPSYRLTIDMSDLDGARIVITTGQSGNPFDRPLQRPDRPVAQGRERAAAVHPGRHRGRDRVDPDPDPVTAEAADVVVIGAGSMGAWTALRSQRAGWRTTLIDAFGAGHPRSTSGDETRILRASHGADTFYTRWSREARTAWQAFGDEIGERLYVESGALWFAHREDGFEAHSMATLTSMGIPVRRIEPDEVTALWPGINADDLAFAVYEPEAGVMLARNGIAAVARRFAAEGGRFELAWAEPGATEGRRLLDVVLADGRRHAAGTFVFAAGPWLPRLFPTIAGDLIRVTKQDVLYLGTPAGDGRFAAEWLPCWIDSDAAFYGTPAIDGRGFKVGPDRYGPPFDPSGGERLVDPDAVRMTRAYVARRFPDLADAPIVETRVCQYETTPDTHFVIDRHPAFDNVWIVGGGSGHGFKHGPVIGSYVVSRLAGAPAGIDEERFAIDRPRVASQNLRTGTGDRDRHWRRERLRPASCLTAPV